MNTVLRRASAAVLGITALAATASITTVPAATAAPTSVLVGQDVIGDGVWAPSHDEALAIIPLCQPLKLISWLDANFSDHGEDIGNFLATRLPALFAAAFSLNPWAAFQAILEPIAQLPVYAINDTTFHVPATLGDILSFCASARA